jgi:ATP-dependent helicase/nuclease subunit A
MMDDAHSAIRMRTNHAQTRASDPGCSAFVSASAGSGKTKLLADRLLRLILSGADPARIQCLTYTKAAAAEMALRLQAALAGWVNMPAPELERALDRLGIPPDAAAVRRARSLFGTVLDLPGGMRIGTIHAFCQSLLRRFPLEAGISPHFEVLTDAEADVLRRRAIERALVPSAPTGDGESRPRLEAARQESLEIVAAFATVAQFDRLIVSMLQDRERLDWLLRQPRAALIEKQRAALRFQGERDQVLEEAVRSVPVELITALGRIAEALDASTTFRERAFAQLDWLSLPEAERVRSWNTWRQCYMTQKGEPRAASKLLNKKLLQSDSRLLPVLLREQQRVVAVDDALRAADVAQASAALLTIALPVLAAYEADKQAATRLDYADLVLRTLALLDEPGAAWVLYKLDGGLDHLLLDEAQDTAPPQWQIARRLVSEFYAGAGASDLKRTIFSVGDHKQSIFSFQGADPAAFDHSRVSLSRLVATAGLEWRDVTLDVSFRSSQPILDLVNAVFADPAATPGVIDAAQHRSDRVGQAGRVELWPLAPRVEPAEIPAWTIPGRRETSTSPPQLLAEALAERIAHDLAAGTVLPSRGRAMAAGDVLILVRRRSVFGPMLIRALKQRGVAVAGLDRMMLTDQPAVADLLALLDTLLLPDDDLALACVLTSPIGGLDQDDLLALAAERTDTLWRSLLARHAERPVWSAAFAMLTELLARVDFVSPYRLIVEALGALGCRARLLARLGPEAAEPLDELLAAAHAYGRDNPPSLQGFVHWLRHSGAEVKREPEAAGDAVRIMTVHGAKGLQAPIVILPDTTSLPKDDDRLCWAGPHGAEVPLWSPHKEVSCAATTASRGQRSTRSAQEYQRLLYVALTRAEDRLVVCGYAPHTLPGGCWYQLVKSGIGRLEARPEAWSEWPGDALVLEAGQTATPDRLSPAAAPRQALTVPEWFGGVPDWRPGKLPDEPHLPARLTPSRPEGREFGMVPEAPSPLLRVRSDVRFRRGHLMHALLQHLPDLPAEHWAAAAEAFLRRSGNELNRDAMPGLLEEVLRVLRAPELAELFGPGSRAEVPLTGVVAGQVIGGLVDRLAYGEGTVVLADYKTNRIPPAGPAEVPRLYLRQMAAYRALLGAAFPRRTIRCLLIWTVDTCVMHLPDPLLDQYAPVDPQTVCAHLPADAFSS